MKKLPIFIILLLSALCSFTLVNYIEKENIIVKVIEKRPVITATYTKWYAITISKSGKKIFEIKTNDLISVGSYYRFTIYGWEINSWSMYKKVIRAFPLGYAEK